MSFIESPQESVCIRCEQVVTPSSYPNLNEYVVCLEQNRGNIAFEGGWRPRQLHPGTRIIHYRCCLPALAGFANYRRERTNGATIELAG